MRVATLTAPSLDFWAAKAAGMSATVDRLAPTAVHVPDPESGKMVPFEPSSDWAQAFPLLLDAWYDIEGVLIDWFGDAWSSRREVREHPLPWFVRAFVALTFGDEVEGWPTGDDE